MLKYQNQIINITLILPVMLFGLLIGMSEAERADDCDEDCQFRLYLKLKEKFEGKSLPETTLKDIEKGPFQRQPEGSPLNRPSQLGRQRQQLDQSYRGLSGAAERSLKSCESRLQDFQLPPNLQGRTVSFVLSAKSKRYASGGFSGSGAMCIRVSRENSPERIYGFILVVYRGGTVLEFPDLNMTVTGTVGQTISKSLGDVGSPRAIRLNNANVSLTITDPPPAGQIIIKK